MTGDEVVIFERVYRRMVTLSFCLVCAFVGTPLCCVNTIVILEPRLLCDLDRRRVYTINRVKDTSVKTAKVKAKDLTVKNKDCRSVLEDPQGQDVSLRTPSLV